MEFCRNSQCPFGDCIDHPCHAPLAFSHTPVNKDETCERFQAFQTAEAEKEDRLKRMSMGDAFIIFQNIENSDICDAEKHLAIWKIATMPTHMGVKKDDMVKALRYLLAQHYEVPPYVK